MHGAVTLPIKKVTGGYKWGNHGKVYSSRAGAEKQAAAAYANGYKGDGDGKTSTKKRSKAKKTP